MGQWSTGNPKAPVACPKHILWHFQLWGKQRMSALRKSKPRSSAHPMDGGTAGAAACSTQSWCWALPGKQTFLCLSAHPEEPHGCCQENPEGNVLLWQIYYTFQQLPAGGKHLLKEKFSLGLFGPDSFSYALLKVSLNVSIKECCKCLRGRKLHT